MSKMSQEEIDKLTGRGRDWFGDYPEFKDFIIRYNDACDIMGYKQVLWIKNMELKMTYPLETYPPEKWNQLHQMLRQQYHRLVERGKIKKG